MEELIVLIVLCLLLLYAYKSSGRLSAPSCMSIMVFALLYLWNRFGILKYSYDFDVRHALYVSLVLLCFIISFKKGMRRIKRSRIPVQTGVVDIKFVVLISFGGLLGGMLLALDTVNSIGIGAYLDGSFNMVRDLYVDVERKTGFFGQIGSVLYGLSLPAVILTARIVITKSASARQCKLLLKILIALGLIFFLVSLTSGGRQSIIEYILCIVAVLIYTGKSEVDRKLIFKLKIFFMVAFVFMSMYFSKVIESRALEGIANEDHIFAVFKVEYKEWYLFLKDYVPASLSLFLAVLHCYYPYNLGTLAVYIDKVGLSTGLMYGGNQAEHFLRQLRKIGLEWPFHVRYESLLDVFDGNMNANTVLGGMIIDFGTIGTLFVVSVLGWFAGKYFGLHIYKKSLVGFWFTCIIFIFIIHGTMYSPFLETLLLYGLMWSFMLKNRLYKKTSSVLNSAPPSMIVNAPVA